MGFTCVRSKNLILRARRWLCWSCRWSLGGGGCDSGDGGKQAAWQRPGLEGQTGGRRSRTTAWFRLPSLDNSFLCWTVFLPFLSFSLLLVVDILPIFTGPVECHELHKTFLLPAPTPCFSSPLTVCALRCRTYWSIQNYMANSALPEGEELVFM